jgi:hypothetical protein
VKGVSDWIGRGKQARRDDWLIIGAMITNERPFSRNSKKAASVLLNKILEKSVPKTTYTPISPCGAGTER